MVDVDNPRLDWEMGFNSSQDQQLAIDQESIRTLYQALLLFDCTSTSRSSEMCMTCLVDVFGLTRTLKCTQVAMIENRDKSPAFPPLSDKMQILRNQSEFVRFQTRASKSDVKLRCITTLRKPRTRSRLSFR